MSVSDTDLPILVHPRGGTPDLIDTAPALAEQVERFAASCGPLAVDVERAAGFRYSSRAYLLQLRREGVGTALIDPVCGADLSDLVRSLNPACWVLHSAAQDLPSLHELGFFPRALFDTEIAARLLGFSRFGLASVCEQLLGVRLDKSHQAEDWSIRPLPRAWLRYAALDVELLIPLQVELSARLQAVGRLDWAEQEFTAILTAPDSQPDPQRWRHRAAKGLTTRYQLAVLRELWGLRDELAAERDLAPTRLVPDRVLNQLASDPPRNRHQLFSLAAMRKPTVRAQAKRWLEAIRRVQFFTESELPQLHVEVGDSPPPRPSSWRFVNPEAFSRYQRLREVVVCVAESLGLEPQLVFPPKVLRQLAWTDVPFDADQLGGFLRQMGVRPWQLDLTEAAVVATVVSFRRECR